MNFGSLLRSIRLRALILYVTILALTISLFSVLDYSVYRQKAMKQIYELMEVKARGTTDALKTYLAAQTQPEPIKGFLSLFVKPKQQADRFVLIAGNLTKGELVRKEDEMEIFVDIFDAHGRLIESTGAVRPELMLKPDDVERLTQGGLFWRRVKLESPRRWPVSVRLLALPVIDAGQLRYIVQTRASLKPFQQQLRQIGTQLFLTGLITLLITGWAGLFLVKFTLQPVEKIVRKIRGIGPANLSSRLILPDTNDEIQQLAVTFNDMLDRLEKSFVSQKQMIQNISHELKTPLTIMRGELEIALKKPRSAQDYDQMLRSLLEEVQEMQLIIDGLLTLARIDNSAETLEMERLSFTKLTESCVEDIRLLSESKNIQISAEVERDVYLTGHLIFLRRMIVNLLDNAVKYTPAQGRIRLEMNRANEWIRLTVIDTGIGIPEKELPRIFERFSRGERGRANDGYGLGLSIVHSIVRAHHGRIEVQSSQASGTRFIVYLPVTQSRYKDFPRGA